MPKDYSNNVEEQIGENILLPNGDAIIVKTIKSDGVTKIDIRTFYEGVDNGEFLPTKKGIRIDLTSAILLKELLEEATRK